MGIWFNSIGDSLENLAGAERLGITPILIAARGESCQIIM